MKILEKFKSNINSQKKKKRFVLSFIGTLLYRIGGALSSGIITFNVYITSYFHYNQVNIDMQYGNLISPIFTMSTFLTSPFAGFVVKKIGLYLTLIISSLLIEIDLILFINQTSIFYSFILIVFLGIGNGIGMEVPLNNLYFYYPKKNGIINSLVGSSSIIMLSGFGVLGEKIINPEKYTLSKDEQFYPLEISQKYIIFYKYILYIYPFVQILGFLLIKKYNPAYDEELIEENNINEIENKDQNQIIKKDENYSKNINSAILDKRIWRITGIIVLSPFSLDFSRNTFRVYGALVSINGTIMQYSSLLTGIPVIIFSPLWGYIADKYKYEILIKILISSSLIISLLLSLFIENNTLYTTVFFISTIFTTGFNIVNRLHILRVYGIKYNLEIWGFIGIFIALFNISHALLSFIISKFYHTGEELKFAYRFVFIGGIIISSIAFYLALYEKDDKFIYPYLQKGKKKEYANMINSDFNEKEKKQKNNYDEDNELELESNSSEITLDQN